MDITKVLEGMAQEKRSSALSFRYSASTKKWIVTFTYTAKEAGIGVGDTPEEAFNNCELSYT